MSKYDFLTLTFVVFASDLRDADSRLTAFSICVFASNDVYYFEDSLTFAHVETSQIAKETTSEHLASGLEVLFAQLDVTSSLVNS